MNRVIRNRRSPPCVGIVVFAHFAALAAALSSCAPYIRGLGRGLSVSPKLDYACSSGRVYIVGQAVSTAPTASTAGVTYSISPALPSGLSLNSSTGAISGTPSGVSPLTSYTLSASNASGMTQTVIALRTANGYLERRMRLKLWALQPAFGHREDQRR